jgi:hypothetical protein
METINIVEWQHAVGGSYSSKLYLLYKILNHCFVTIYNDDYSKDVLSKGTCVRRIWPKWSAYMGQAHFFLAKWIGISIFVPSGR